MRRRRLSTTFQSLTPLTPRLTGLSYNAFPKYRPILRPEECSTDDPLENGFIFESLVGATTIPQVDQYGLNGFNQRRAPDGKSKLSNWTICPNYDYCDGPLVEDVTQPKIYTTRWAAYYDPDSGTIKYGKKNSTVKNASIQLFPDALVLSETDQISMCFDANARASFAFQFTSSDIQIRRFEASTPTTYQFTGTNPRLFYDGILQRDNTLQDIVCCYVNGGSLCVRFQRDNFAIEYVMYAPSGTEELLRVTKTDKNEYFQVVFYTSVDNRQYAVRSMVYQPFPDYYIDTALSSVTPLSGDYSSSVIIIGPYLDAAINSVAPLSGEYNSSTIPTGPYSDSGTNTVTPLSGTYNQVTVQTGPYSDSGTNSVNPLSGEYNNVSVNGGSYVDSGTNTVQPLSGNYS